MAPNTMKPKMRVTRRKYSRMPSCSSHLWSPYRRLWEKYAAKARHREDAPLLSELQGPGLAFAIDPFARNCDWAYPWNNDINPDMNANHALDAELFLESAAVLGEKFSIGLLDPPFSDPAAMRTYGTEGNLYVSDSAKMTRIQFQLGELIRDGGYIIKMGYNSNPPHPSFDLVELSIVACGGSINDVLISVWQMNQKTLEAF